ncbi:MAG TPA: cobyric acid synthase [Aeromicrobium sp.]|nr:cobyric acid synthase [Aeromicrobium sp.]
MTNALLVAGTTSDAGKSLVTAALCRAFRRRGVVVAPFKAQNMSNNSMVVGSGPDGGSVGEIGRAQWVQALAADVTPETAMNPVLLKPGSDHHSHVVVNGRPAGTISAEEFIGGRTHLAESALAAFDDLASRFDVVVCEGAGSPAEINLRDGDYTNMGLARHAGMPVVVVGDIDRGGVFASLFGTVALLEADDQRLVSGFIINKFRGNHSLLKPGVERLTELTGRPTYGVLPWSPDVWLDSEDALNLATRGEGPPSSPLRFEQGGTPSAGGRHRPLAVGVIRFPRISNFTDIDALSLEPGVEVSWISDPGAIAGVDLIVLPGTRATIADLSWLRFRGLDRAIAAHASAGRPVLGICGGFQMLGRRIHDPAGVEGQSTVDVYGLALLDATTTFTEDKVLRAHGDGAYEIHHGRVDVGDADAEGGWTSSGVVMGTMRHGSLESDETRTILLDLVASAVGQRWKPSTVSFAAAREARLDLLGDLAEKHLDVDALLDLARNGAPEVPLLSSGAEAPRA